MEIEDFLREDSVTLGGRCQSILLGARISYGDTLNVLCPGQLHRRIIMGFFEVDYEGQSAFWGSTCQQLGLAHTANTTHHHSTFGTAIDSQRPH